MLVRTLVSRTHIPSCLAAAALAIAGCESDANNDHTEGDTTVEDTHVGDGDASGDIVGDAVPDVGNDASVDDPDPDTDRPRACLGHPDLCDRPFDQVVLPGTHNSMSARDADFLGPNQEYGVARQLDDGIRALLLDSAWWRDEVYFCHSDCRLGASPAVEVLEPIRAFLDDHPDDLIAIIFQNGISGDETVELLHEFGLDTFAITPPARGDAWPTTAELLDSGQRALFTLEFGSSSEPWLRNAWDVFFDTPYTFHSADEFSCELNRGHADNGLFLLNHWIADPITYPALAELANDRDVLLARARDCAEQTDHLPNILAVDFYDIGDLFPVVDELNGLTR